jgi:hypothetical protein
MNDNPHSQTNSRCFESTYPLYDGAALVRTALALADLFATNSHATRSGEDPVRDERSQRPLLGMAHATSIREGQASKGAYECAQLWSPQSQRSS